MFAKYHVNLFREKKIAKFFIFFKKFRIFLAKQTNAFFSHKITESSRLFANKMRKSLQNMNINAIIC